MDLSSILTHYSLGTIRSATQLSESSGNLTFQIQSDSGSYSLRVFRRDKKSEEIAFEHEVLQHLAEQGFISPRLIQTNEGLTFSQNEPFFAVSEFLPGHALRGPEINTEHVHSVGETLGWFHELLIPFQPQHEKDMQEWEQVSAFFQQRKGNWLQQQPSFSEKIEIIEKGLSESQLPADLPLGIVHSDLHEQNVVFRHGHVSGVLDFDRCTKGSYVLDLANTIAWWCFRDGHFHHHLAEALIRGYVTQRPISAEEKVALWLALKFALVRLAIRFTDQELLQAGQEETLGSRASQISADYFISLYLYCLEKKEKIQNSLSAII